MKSSETERNPETCLKPYILTFIYPDVKSICLVLQDVLLRIRYIFILTHTPYKFLTLKNGTVCYGSRLLCVDRLFAGLLSSVMFVF